MIVSLGVVTSNVTIANAAWSIITGATPGRARLLELGLFLGAATACTIGLGRPASAGTTPTTPVNFLVEDPNDVLNSGALTSALAWSAQPGAPTNFLRRIGLPATIGVGVIWTFPKGLVLPVSGSPALVLWNITATPIMNAYAVFDI